MENLNQEKIVCTYSLTELDKLEMQNTIGGEGSLRRFFNWLGEKAGELFPCYCSTGITYENYQEYVNPNDPLM
jgi:hypothetical protein